MKSIIQLLSVFVFITVSPLIAEGQTEYGNYQLGHEYDLDIINTKPLKDLRKRKSGDNVIGIMTFIPFNSKDANIDLLNFKTVEINNDHRKTEQLTPNYKKYISNNTTIGLGIYYKRIAEKLNGTLATTQNEFFPIREFIAKGQGIYLRPSIDRHYSTLRFRKFDLDLYAGASISTGFTPLKEINFQSNDQGDYNNITTKSKSFGLGFDAYQGVNLQFDRFSFGLELLLFGVDYNSGFGKTYKKIEQSIANVTTSTEYFDYNGEDYSEISISRNSASMYRGIRIQFSYYIFK
jgi:hypothetical protein